MADERLTLRQAAARLGVSESAIRKRVERGTLHSDKGQDGRRYVYLDTGADTVSDTGADPSAIHEPDTLISEMRGRIEDLRDQLQAERQAHAEARRLLARALERIPPAIEAPEAPGPSATPTDAGEGPQTPTEATDEQQGRGPIPDAGGPQEPAQPRSWWQRMFGG